MRMAKPGSQRGETEAGREAAGFEATAGKQDAAFAPDETLLSMDELNIGGGLTGGVKAGVDGVTRAGGLSEEESAVDANLSATRTLHGISLAEQPEAPRIPADRFNMTDGEPAASTFSPNPEWSPSTRFPMVPRGAGEDIWMDFIEAHPELSYHQAEILRLVAGMAPETMDGCLDRCGYLLDRMRRLGPSALNLKA